MTTLANAGFVQDGTTGVKTSYNGVTFSGGYIGYDDGASGKGFPDDSHFLVVANPILALKAASNAAINPNNDTFGSFGFGFGSSSSKPLGSYDIGLDYILAGGNTGRAYFALPSGPATVPEVSTSTSLLAGSLMLCGLLLARRRSAKAS